MTLLLVLLNFLFNIGRQSRFKLFLIEGCSALLEFFQPFMAIKFEHNRGNSFIRYQMTFVEKVGEDNFCKKTSGYHVLIAPAILYAYELTGDNFFLENGRAMYAQTIQEKSVNAINNCYWNTPTLLYYLKRFGL